MLSWCFPLPQQFPACLSPVSAVTMRHSAGCTGAVFSLSYWQLHQGSLWALVGVSTCMKSRGSVWWSLPPDPILSDLFKSLVAAVRFRVPVALKFWTFWVLHPH